ncbi:hypothetical protein TUMEXPCC7403_00205 [Tumidithrix helvetica PCC 7403]|uniref:eCIS core domain-containing protein n=1 Tax=Tumidithrix helvetica TaxID=3457545 RepID=UPI003C8BC239
MSEYTNKPAAQSSFVPPAVQIQTRPFAPPQVQPSAAPQNVESSQAERDSENQDKRSAQENLYFTDLSFSGSDDRGSSESVMQRKWEGIVQRYKEGGNTAPDPNHGYTPVRGSSQSIMQRKLDEMRQRVKEGGNTAPDPNYEYTPVRGSSQSIMQRKHQEMVQRYRENQAKTIQAKLAIGAVGDKYEQEADRVAAEVVQKINAPESVQREEAPEEDEEIQMKPLSDTTQPMETALPQTDRQPENIAFAPSPQVVAPISPTINAVENVQREEEEEEREEEIEEGGKLQMKPLSESIQRFESPEDDEALQMKSLSDVIQREEMPEEEEEIQAKSLVQRRDTLDGGEASADLESSIQSARGSGQSLDPSLQAKMGEAMGADFSGVKVHTDTQSDQLNQSIQARAFTTGQDVFFRQGAYDPSSLGGQELIAHELTHVVQQNGGAVQRSPQKLEQHKQHPNPKVSSASVEDYEIQAKDEIAGNSQVSSEKQHPNQTGMPDSLKTGIESLSGYSMDDVRVHYNSDKPTQFQAHAFARGTEIHVASGQEKHLPHEAWHVAQQKQGRVQPTVQYHGAIVNDDAGLEKEADLMGLAALNESNQKDYRKNATQLVSNSNVYQLSGWGFALTALTGTLIMVLGTYLKKQCDEQEANEKTDLIVTNFEERMTQDEGFVDHAQVRENNFILAAEKYGVEKSAAKDLFNLSGAANKDTVTGFDVASDREPSVSNAIKYIKEHKEATGFYVEVDIRNLGGLNSVLGHTGANEVFKHIAKLCDDKVQNIKTTKVKVASFRHGGNKFSFLVVAEDGSKTKESVEKQLNSASDDIKKFVEETSIETYNKNPEKVNPSDKLATIEHPKHKGEKEFYGTGIAFGVSQITENSTVNTIIGVASPENGSSKNATQLASHNDTQSSGWDFALATLTNTLIVPLRNYLLSQKHDEQEAAKKTDLIVTDFEERMTQDEGFVDHAQVRENNFILAAMKQGVKEPAARNLFTLSGAANKDTVTGFDVASDREPSVSNAIKYIKEHKEATGFYVEVDIRNLGGLNSVLGHTGANEVFKHIAKLCDDKVQAIKTVKVKVGKFRHGGDEFSFLVVAEDGSKTKESVEKQLNSASDDIKKFVEETSIGTYNKNPEKVNPSDKLATIEHPKHKGKKEFYGTGIVFGVSQIIGNDTIDKVLSAADLEVESKKTK